MELSPAALKKRAKIKLKWIYGRSVAVSLIFFTFTLMLAACIIFGWLAFTDPAIRNVSASDPKKLDMVIRGVIVAVWGAAIYLFLAPLKIGRAQYYLNAASLDERSVGMLFSYLPRFWNAAALELMRTVRTVLFSLLLFVPGIVKGTSHALAPFLLAQDPALGAGDALQMSRRLMRGNRRAFFRLLLSFSGWFFLCLLTAGFGSFVLAPYFHMTVAEFYLEVKRAPDAPQRGEDLSAEITVSFEEAFSGCEKSVSVQADVACSACGGKGFAPGTQSACPLCGGAGTCAVGKEVRVPVPAGIDEGQRIPLPRKGAPGKNGGPVGDLFLTVRLERHPLFRREGNDVIYDAPLSLAEAALGCEITVPTLRGEVPCTVIPGTQPGYERRLNRYGFPAPDGGRRGDQRVRFTVTVPRTLTPKQKALLAAFAEEADAAPAETAGPKGKNEHETV